jgi:hypothetical protein
MLIHGIRLKPELDDMRSLAWPELATELTRSVNFKFNFNEVLLFTSTSNSSKDASKMSINKDIALVLAVVFCRAFGQTVGTVTTLVGGGAGGVSGIADGSGTAALFVSPTYVACDSAGTSAVVVSIASHYST